MKKQSNTNTPRVVRTGKKKYRKPKKPLKPGIRITKAIFVSILKIIITTGLVLTITACIVGTALTIYVMEFIDADSTIDLNSLELNNNSVIYAKDANGEDVEVQRLRRGENRTWVDFQDIPQNLKDAVVYTEDERFNDHKGVDFKRTLAAFLNEFNIIKLSGGRQGGSTITQQLIKNINGDIDRERRTVDVKIQEIFQAMNMERHYSKEQILEQYLNCISLHFNINGVQAGANVYFGKDVSELNLVECVTLAVISKDPSYYNPVQNPENNKKRRTYALDKMLEFNAITKEEYDATVDLDPVLIKTDQSAAKPVEGETVKKKGQSYYEDAVIEEVIADLMKEYDYSYEYAENLTYTSGYKIYTPMEIETQKILETYFEDPSNFYFKNDKKKDLVPDNAYMVIMNYDGDIVALVGGKGEKPSDRGLNRATMSVRSFGSTVKPLSVYAPAFERDLINWSTIMEDSAVTKVKDPKTGVERAWPSNYNKKYEGNMLMIEAIKVSKNTIPVRIVEMLTPQVSFDFLYNDLHLKSLIASGSNHNANAASMALGEGGVILTDLTAAYQIFGNGGYYREDKTYNKVVDNDGKVILDATTRKKTRVISPQTAYVMNRALREVVRAKPGSGRDANMKDYEVIGKTGTSSDRLDLLFMGLTPYYIGGIRYGNDDNSIIEYDGKSQIIVWKEVMDLVHKGKNPAKFELDTGGAVEFEYCAASGLLAHPGCPKKVLGYYKTTGIPATCTVHAFDGTTVPPVGTPPVGDGTTPPVGDGTTPPVGDGTTPPVGDGTTPPVSDTTIPPVA